MSDSIVNRIQRRRGDLFAEACPSRSVLEHVTSRWGSLVLILLRDGTKRFSEIRREIGGVSEKMLAQTLQALEGDGFLTRKVYPTVPPRVEYTLTPLGHDVSEHVLVLALWVEKNLGEVMKRRESHAASRKN
ncbi:MAG: helix-turn-helix domain-containing protein [Acidobacteriaceae bacterium]|nr:helix-turn-helix domain-containing protein [Acidobacteriaceae bacterium]